MRSIKTTTKYLTGLNLQIEAQQEIHQARLLIARISELEGISSMSKQPTSNSASPKIISTTYTLRSF